jgi:putative transcriptional regulator
MSKEDIQLPNFENESVPASLEGYFLISEMELIDPNFYKTVVFMVEHNEQGAFGLVVNRKADAVLGEVVEGITGPLYDSPIYVGGPVQQNLLFILHSGLPAEATGEYSKSSIPGVIFEPVSERMITYLNEHWEDIPESQKPETRFYVGYSGWGPGQLEEEMKIGSWLIHKATPDIVFHKEPEMGWKDALSKKGTFYKIIAETGCKPSIN